MAIDFQGRFLATASEKGTLIRIFTTEDATLIQELRRGTDKALIFSLNFNLAGTMLACSSADKSTIHIFTVP
jgi:WD40 repeat protein